MLLKIEPNFESMFCFYQHDQIKVQFIERKINNQFKIFSSFEQISELYDCRLVLDDSCEEIIKDKEFSKLATTGRHKK